MTYNQRETCIEAINSLLVQTLALDLIIVSDDCSTDGTYELIADYFSKNGKPSNVELYQSEKNLGFIPHFNALLKNHCRDDDLIFYNAGDDLSEISRVEEFYREYVAKGKPRHFLGHSYVTSFGSGAEEILVPPIESIKENRELCLIASAYHIGASQVFTGALFSDFGPILFDDCYEDLTLGYRALLKNAYHFIPKALLRYRIGGLSGWQQNPLEKKRGRLKSTLTQRAVDSMQSGDFEALTTIQDCYSQYGFSQKPHRDKMEIIVLSEECFRPRSGQYTISDHFEILHNVLNTARMTPEKFNYQDINALIKGDKTLLWIALPKITHAFYARSILEGLKWVSRNNSKKIVLDTGLYSGDVLSANSRNFNKVITDFLDANPDAQLHSACAHYSATLPQTVNNRRLSYLQPLHVIDGPDPNPRSASLKRGLVVVCDPPNESLEKLKIIGETFSACEDRGFQIETVFTDQFIFSTNTNASQVQKEITAPVFGSIDNYDFLILVSTGTKRNYEEIQYWWSEFSKRCRPVFLTSGAAHVDTLQHGMSCLFVDSNVPAWSKAIDLLINNSEALKLIAANARRETYFKHSIQKNISLVASVLSRATGQLSAYGKVLPL